MRKTIAAVAFALLLPALAGCTPHEGDNCPSEGSYYRHTERHKTVELRCIDGRWRKV